MKKATVLVVAIWLSLVSGMFRAEQRKQDKPWLSYTDHKRLLVSKDAEGKEHPIRTPDEWRRRAAHIRYAFEHVMGGAPAGARIVPVDMRVTEEVKTPRYIRKLITFAVAEDDRLPAYLFIPTERKGKLPAVLCLHPTNRELGKGSVAGIGGKEDRHYAVHLAERGYVTLAPDYPNMGGYKVDVYGKGWQSTTAKALWNHSAALLLLAELPEVDRDNLGVMGHSLGGHNAIFTGVMNFNVKCVVSNCGFCSFPRYMKGDLKGWSHEGYMPRIKLLYDLKPEKVPFDFTELVAVMAPRAFLASAPVRDHNFDVEGVKECIEAARPVYKLLGAEEKLAANYPDADHNFPPEVREVAYKWLDRWLK